MHQPLQSTVVILVGALAGIGCSGNDVGRHVSDVVVPTDAAVTPDAREANRAPTVVAARIHPDAPVTGDIPQCTAVGFRDPDGDPDQSQRVWTRDGVDEGASLAGAVTRGEALTCAVTASDGVATGNRVTLERVVGNARPAIAGVTIAPAGAPAGTPLTCSWTGFTDLEGDADASTVRWTRNGVDAGAGPTLAVSATNDVVVCSVTPHDGRDAGDAVAAQVTVGNAPPAISDVWLDPVQGYAGDPFRCHWSGFTDAEGDADASFARWLVNGVEMGSGPRFDQPLRAFDVLTCAVVPFDGHSEGVAVTAQTSVLNSAPDIGGVRISPSVPLPGVPLTCSWSDWFDADGHSDQSSLAWSVNGAAWWHSPVLGGGFETGDTVTCAVTPFDGIDTGVLREARVTIGNAPPVVALAAIVPASPRATDTVRCRADGAHDAEGDAVDVRFHWRRDGVPVGGDSAVFPGALSAGEALSCEAVPFDAFGTGIARFADAVVANTPPSVTDVTISPPAPQPGDTVRCSWTWIDADDPLAQPDRSEVVWAIDGVQAGVGAVLGQPFHGGDVLSCTVYPDDGVDQGPPVAASVRVAEMGPPSVASVTVTPQSPHVGDVLTCSWAGFDSPLGGPDLSTVRWRVGTTEIAEGPTLDGGFARGDEVACAVEPFDGTMVGGEYSVSVLVGNAPPSVSGAVVQPPQPTAGETVSCKTVDWHDADGNPDISLATWFINGAPVGTGQTYTSGGFQFGDTVSCQLTPYDGLDEGAAVTAQAQVANSPPSIQGVVITPDPATATDALSCSWTGFADADDHSDQSFFTWHVNGVPADNGPVPGVPWVRGDEVSCTVTPSDGMATGVPVQYALLVENSPPTATGAILSPSDPMPSDVLTCSLVGWSDPDGDPEQALFWWAINGVYAGAEATLSPTAALAAGDEVRCVATPFDGVAETAGHSATATVGNAAPTINAVSILPSPLVAGATPSCQWSYSDPDGDADLSTVLWQVNGVEAGTGAVLITPLVHDDVVTCVVTPFDGQSTGPGMLASQTVVNTPPIADEAIISPSEVFAGVPVSCSAGGFDDADGDSDQSLVSWLINDIVSGAGNPFVGAYTAGDIVSCSLTPFDGRDPGVAVIGSAEVLNTEPAVTNVAVSPTVVNPGVQTVRCTWDFTDGDGDADLSTVSWFLDTNPIASGPDLTRTFVEGQALYCAVTPSDGTQTGLPVDSLPVVVGGASGPSVSSVTITPDPAVAGDTLMCKWFGFVSPSGGTDQSTVEWRVNGAFAGDGATFTGTFVRDDVVTCVVVPFDGVDVGAEVATSIVIANTPPAPPTVVLDPGATATDDSPLQCVVDVPPQDADGDSLAGTFTWYLNGYPYGPPSDVPVSIPASETTPGDVWKCSVSVSDGFAAVTGDGVIEVRDSTLIIWGADKEFPLDMTLLGDVVIRSGTSVVISDGADVVGNGHTISLQDDASLRIGHSTPMSDPSILTDVIIRGYADALRDHTGYSISLQFTTMNGGVLHDSAGQLGELLVRDSMLQDTLAPILCHNPTGSCAFERTLFERAYGIQFDIGLSGSGLVRDCTFDTQSGLYAVEKIAGDASKVVVYQNSFLSTDRVAVSLPAGASGGFEAIQNHWVTKSELIVEAMIHDQNDDPGSPGVVSYLPVLAEPSPDAP